MPAESDKPVRLTRRYAPEDPRLHHGAPAARPEWLRVPAPGGDNYRELKDLVHAQRLHTVCESARCPNIGECWQARTATFLILGNACTRGCAFCAVSGGQPVEYDLDEPRRVAEAVAALRLRYAVVTSVTRDDLPDGGAFIFAETIRRIRAALPGCRVEVLIPDFQGDAEALATVLRARPDVLNHNIETVERLYSLVRPQADYRRSLALLARAKMREAVTKSGIMLGLGESAGGSRRRAARPACRQLRHRHHRPVPAPLAGPPAGAKILHAGRIRRVLHPGDHPRFPAHRIRSAGALLVPCGEWAVSSGEWAVVSGEW